MKFDREKFNRLVHYIIWKADDKAKLGSTKLNKILWLSEMRHYQQHGQPMTGARYVKREHGPVPRAIMHARQTLQDVGAIREWTDRRFAGNKGKAVFEATRAPDTSMFSSVELREVDYWIDHVLHEHTAESISDLTHDDVWEMAAIGEEIPMHATFATRIREPSRDEISWARRVAERLGLK